MPMASSWIVFWKRAFHIYVHMHVYVFIFEALSCKPWSLNLALVLQTPFFDWRLLRFGKELFICQNTLPIPLANPTNAYSHFVDDRDNYA